MDTLSSLLSTFRLDVEIINNAQYCGDWAIDTSGTGHISFHLVTHGQCMIESDCLGQPALLETGDFIMFPHDSAHVIESRNQCGVKINSSTPHSYDEGLKEDGVGLLCGYFRFHHPINNPLINVMPNVLLKQKRQQTNNKALATLMDLLYQEALSSRAGRQAAINRLTEALFILLVRDLINSGHQQQGLAAAIADTRIGKALDAIHGEPESAWTVEKLANIASMSRSAFAELFKNLLDETPMSYLSRWRMQNACVWLIEEGASIYDVAVRCGYETEAAFAKAFKRIVGKTPGAVRSSA